MSGLHLGAFESSDVVSGEWQERKRQGRQGWETGRDRYNREGRQGEIAMTGTQEDRDEEETRETGMQDRKK